MRGPTSPPLGRSVEEWLRTLAGDLWATGSHAYVAAGLPDGERLRLIVEHPQGEAAATEYPALYTVGSRPQAALDAGDVLTYASPFPETELMGLAARLPAGTRSLAVMPVSVGAGAPGVLVVASEHVASYADPYRSLLGVLGRWTGLMLEGSHGPTAGLRLVRALEHELRTPLTPVVSSASLLKQVLEPTATGQEAALLANLWTGVERLRKTINDFLALARLQVGDMEPSVELVDLGPLVGEVVEALQQEAHQRGQGVVLEVAEDVPPVQGHREWLRDLLSRLVRQGLRMSKEGKAVIMRVHRGDEDAHIEVEDHGTSLPLAERQRLLASAWPEPWDRNPTPGLGRDLSVCREIVCAHGGTMRAGPGQNGGLAWGIALPGGRGTSHNQGLGNRN